MTAKTLWIGLVLTVVTQSYSGAQIATLGPHLDIDSLHNLLKYDADDTNKIFHLNALGRELSNSKTDTAMLLASKALQLAEKLKWPRGIAHSQLILGWCENVKGNYPQAMAYLQSAIAAENKIGKDVIISAALSVMGGVYDNDKDPVRALEYYFKALAMDKEMGNFWGISRNTGVAGFAYAQQKKYDTALKQYFSALAMTDSLGNKNGSAVWMGYIGDVYKKLEQDSQALYYYRKALVTFEELGNKWKIAELLSNLGAVLVNQKKYRESCSYLYRSLALAQTLGAQNTSANTYEALSALFEQNTIPLPDTIPGRMLNLIESRTRSLDYYKQHIKLRDSIYSSTRVRHLLRKEFEHKLAIGVAIQNQKSRLEKLETKKYRIITIALLANSIILVLLVFYIVKDARTRRKLEAEQLRNRLSRDLHDDIGSTLSSINILSRTAQKTLQNSVDTKTKDSLEKINERSQRLLISMSDIIWNMKPGNDTIEEVMSRMREYATEILEAKNIEYTFNFPTEKVECRLSMEMKNNLYLVFKEAVNNLSKYANCSVAVFSLSIEDNAIHLEIEDDGIGFDADELSHVGGLHNMRHRAKEMQGSLIITSQKNSGTHIALTVPRYSAKR